VHALTDLYHQGDNLGYSRPEFEKLHISDIDPFQSPDEIQASLRTVLEEGIAEFEVQHVTKRGEIRDVRIITKVVNLSGRTLLHTIWRDITGKRRALNDLQEAKAWSESLIAALSDGVSVQDTNLKVLFQNKVHKNLLGEHQSEYCYQAYDHREDRCEDCPVAKSLLDGRIHRTERSNPFPEGIRHFEITASPVKDSEGKIIAGLEVVREITDRKQAEKALHLSVNLTTQLLAFSRGGKPIKKKTDLRLVIENAVKFALSGSNVDSLPCLNEGAYIEISVQDSGIGIPKHFLPKIFDPYFTTKEKGSGLGLATSYSIVANHGGMIDVSTEIGNGTIFSVYLPAIKEKFVSSASPADNSAARRGKILVMDDEELIRDLAEELIITLGHEVEVAKNGEAALEMYQRALEVGNPFDAVILDLTIRGGLGGIETNKRLQAMDPKVKTVVSSGYSDDAMLSGYPASGFKACLKKPYGMDELRRILNALLTEKSG